MAHVQQLFDILYIKLPILRWICLIQGRPYMIKLNLRFLGPIKTGFWAHKAHKSTQKWVLGTFTAISYI